ncbi:hypothetical protein [Paenibacillus sp. IHBB 3054]|uniref:hypothetical protein n=1 Tax=Paenibacillus sp. IHBB 3054 TaxID=3425689 RepID=UPI003F66B8E1
MKKRVQAGFIGAYILIILVGVIWHAGGVSAEETIKLRVNSHTTSTEIMSNMQPGDATTSDYTVINEGHERFNYFVDFKFTSGDEELYNILQMTLQKEGVILYSGVMSEAEGRVAIGTLTGGSQEVLQMDVSFPLEAGNEYQGKTTSVDFIFSASASPEPTAEPSATPVATATPGPTSEPSPTASATVTPGPTTDPGATPAASASTEPSGNPTSTPSSGPTASPGITATPGTSAAPTGSPAVTASPGTAVVTVTDEPVPMGGADNGTPQGSATPTPKPSPAPSDDVIIDDDEIPLSGPEDGDKLPDTAEPWYNLILISLAVAILSIIVLRRLNSKK